MSTLYYYFWFLKPLKTSAEAYVKTFMNETIGDDSEKSLLQMKRKPLMVDPYPKVKLKKRNKAMGLSAKQKRELGLYVIPKNCQKWVKLIRMYK